MKEIDYFYTFPICFYTVLTILWKAVYIFALSAYKCRTLGF